MDHFVKNQLPNQKIQKSDTKISSNRDYKRSLLLQTQMKKQQMKFSSITDARHVQKQFYIM